MVVGILAIMTKDKNMDQVITSGMMVLLISDNGLTMLLKGSGNILGMMEEFIMAIGMLTTWMEWANTSGVMAEHIQENTNKTKNMDMDCISGQMEENTMAIGSKEDNMDLDLTLLQKKNQTNMDFGKTVNELSGSQRKMLLRSKLDDLTGQKYSRIH